jgi:hypothetical protein
MFSTGVGTLSVDVQLRALVGKGFRFVDPRDEHGDVVAVVGVRAHDNVLDVVELHGEDDAVATRMPPDQDVLNPRRYHWREQGPASAVMARLLSLPDDYVPGMLYVPARVSA